MVCVSQERTYSAVDERRVVLVADVTPDTLPTTGAGVSNLPDDVTFAPGSVLMALDTSSRYIANESGEFVLWEG